MSVLPNYVPRNFKTINVLLKVNDGEAALRFYNSAFGAEVLEKLIDSEGILQYAELKIEDTIIMVNEDKWFSEPRGIVLQIYTGDVEGVFETAISAGAEEISPISKHFYGDRAGRLKDPFGYEWVIATHMEDVPPQELKKRFEDLYS
jgi:PhnB protein